jgi:hypothetical protein
MIYRIYNIDIGIVLWYKNESRGKYKISERISTNPFVADIVYSVACSIVILSAYIVIPLVPSTIRSVYNELLLIDSTTRAGLVCYSFGLSIILIIHIAFVVYTGNELFRSKSLSRKPFHIEQFALDAMPIMSSVLSWAFYSYSIYRGFYDNILHTTLIMYIILPLLWGASLIGIIIPIIHSTF